MQDQDIDIAIGARAASLGEHSLVPRLSLSFAHFFRAHFRKTVRLLPAKPSVFVMADTSNRGIVEINSSVTDSYVQYTE